MEYPSICDGSDATVISTRSCTIAMERFASPITYDVNGLIDQYGMGLAQGDLIVAVVSTINDKGEGPVSEVNTEGELAQTVPAAPPSAPYRGIGTSDNQLDVEWGFLTTGAENGGSSIVSYSLEVDDGAGGSFIEIIGGSPLSAPYTLNSKIVTTAVASGATYQVRYRAYNVHGWGDYSPTGSITAATVPDATDEPSLAIVGTDVQISWSEPSDTGGTGVAITSYKIEILLADGSYREDTANCDGTDSTIVAATSCTIPMSTLTSTDATTGFSFA